ncbi:hypothetical protein RB195_016731 [Necator americanus]|uniref:PIG-P domain-containing protein n=1 Tax=Necator americanus TaxID=51031 RepID=A0ABR1C4G1_NECAM
MPTQEATEDIHTPNPLPARGIYGFSLYISSFCALILYTLWAVVPSPLLNKAGVSYVPAKYWVILVPLIIVVSISSFVLIIFTLNVYRFRGYKIFEEVQTIANDFGENIISTPDKDLLE